MKLTRVHKGPAGFGGKNVATEEIKTILCLEDFKEQI
jgi:hypothetical protein